MAEAEGIVDHLMSLPDLVAAAIRPGCEVCMGIGWVCENHPDRPWAAMLPECPTSCECGAGMPCPCTGMM